MQFRFLNNKLEVYGLTQNTDNNEYMMVFQYANRGSLHEFLKSNFRKLKWIDKLEMLLDISEDLAKVLEAGYVHCDIHSGNILHNQYPNGHVKTYISDLGLSRKEEDFVPKGCTYGVLPYMY